MRAQESIQFSNISVTPARFVLSGGKYQSACIGTGFGTVAVRQLGPDGITTVAASGNHAANGILVFDVGPGTYELTITTTTAVYSKITRIPGE
jgi:hypothetical protein